MCPEDQPLAATLGEIEERDQSRAPLPYLRHSRSHPSGSSFRRINPSPDVVEYQRCPNDTEGDTVKVLPDHSNSHGHPLGEDECVRGGYAWNSLHGDIECRNTYSREMRDVGGRWSVAGPDSNTVNHMAQNISEIIDNFGGQQSGFLDTISKALKGLQTSKTLKQ